MVDQDSKSDFFPLISTQDKKNPCIFPKKWTYFKLLFLAEFNSKHTEAIRTNVYHSNTTPIPIPMPTVACNAKLYLQVTMYYVWFKQATYSRHKNKFAGQWSSQSSVLAGDQRDLLYVDAFPGGKCYYVSSIPLILLAWRLIQNISWPWLYLVNIHKLIVLCTLWILPTAI